MKIIGQNLSLNDIKNIKKIFNLENFELNQQYKINSSNYIKIISSDSMYIAFFQLVRKCPFGGNEIIDSKSTFHIIY